MFTYEEYGLRISSAIPLSNRTQSREPADVIIRLGYIGALPHASEATKAGTNFRVTAQGVFLFWDGIGTILVRKGRDIIVDPAQKTDDRTLRQLLLGPAFAALLHQRGRLILHASAVAINDGVAAFAGNPGQGKSSLALALYALGHDIVADDVTSIEFDGVVPIVFPSSPQINVWPETLSALTYDPATLSKVEHNYEKRVFPVTERFSMRRLPLRNVYVLREGDEAAIESLSAQEAFIALIQHSYAVKLLDGSDAATHVHQCAALVKTTGVCKVIVPRNLVTLPHVAQMIADAARQRPLTSNDSTGLGERSIDL
ncbi:MAG: hypothetical protein ABSC87_07470 [Halobacteriota archaeon]|jgi:hypothetical protein